MLAAARRLPRPRSSSRPIAHVERARRHLARATGELAAVFLALHDARVTATSSARIKATLDMVDLIASGAQRLSADTRQRLTERGKELGRARLRLVRGGKDGA
jgi:hypothetical protein